MTHASSHCLTLLLATAALLLPVGANAQSLFSRNDPAPTSDMYFIGNLGINFADGATSFPRNEPVRFNTEYGAGFGANAGIGYRFSRYFRADAQLGYLFSTYDTENLTFNGVGGGVFYDDSSPYTDIGTAMVNAYVDVPFTLTKHVHDYNGGYQAVPDDNTWGWYGGGGVGLYATDDNIGTAYQLMTGLSFRINDRLILDAGYKYFAVASGLEERRLQVTYPFTGAVSKPNFEIDYDANIFETGIRYQF